MTETRFDHRIREYELRAAKWNARTAMFGAMESLIHTAGWALVVVLLALIISNPQSPAVAMLAELLKRMK